MAWVSAKDLSVHSTMLSAHFFLSLPLHRLSSMVPWSITLVRSASLVAYSRLTISLFISLQMPGYFRAVLWLFAHARWWFVRCSRCQGSCVRISTMAIGLSDIVLLWVSKSDMHKEILSWHEHYFLFNTDVLVFQNGFSLDGFSRCLSTPGEHFCSGTLIRHYANEVFEEGPLFQTSALCIVMSVCRVPLFVIILGFFII